MKFNWGTGLTVVILIFMTATLGFVFFALTQDFDLVEEHYYAKSEEYQQHINSNNRLQSLPQSPQYTILNTNLKISLPPFFKGKKIDGILHFYRADNEKLDTKVEARFDNELNQTIKLGNFKVGKWQLKLNFTADNKSYYDEYDFFIQ